MRYTKLFNNEGKYLLVYYYNKYSYINLDFQQYKYVNWVKYKYVSVYIL